jgi:nucleoside phosphorylase
VAGGNHTGIIINKQIANGAAEELPSQMSLEFKVFLINSVTKKHTLESRVLRFWFKDEFPASERAKLCQEFFKELVSPSEFPRDYVGFIMKIMKLMQGDYLGIRKVEIELQQLEETDKPPERPLSADDGSSPGGKVEVSETKLLEMIESAYPNPLTLVDISKQVQSGEEEIKPHLASLQSKGLIKTLDNNAFTRVVQNETQVRIVKQMPKIIKAKQPTIAIITAQYCEKLAVDAMIDNPETFVRYTTVGESNVYTLGNIGSHRVVSTKLPSVGHTREAMIAAGNTTTRLLGTFQKVDFVFLIGTGGGVPHFTDYSKHVRLGDVVVSAPSDNQKFVYMYCDKATEKASGGLEFETRGWIPSSLVLQEIASTIKDEGEEEWAQYVSQGLKYLKEQEADFDRPPASSDKLYMAIGEKDVIEVAHPTPPQPVSNKKKIESRVHLGCIASGRHVARDDHLRQDLASRLGIMAYDSEFDSVLESVLGNRRDSFIVIRGIADYKDGTRRRDWQPHAALVAAAFAKAVASRMEPPVDD